MDDKTLREIEERANRDWVGWVSSKELYSQQRDIKTLLAEVKRLQGELDAAKSDCSGYCATCAFVNDCAKHDNNDAAPSTWYYGDCSDWQWRGSMKGE